MTATDTAPAAETAQPLSECISPGVCTCPICGYTEHDAQFQMDHRFCKGEIPPREVVSAADLLTIQANPFVQEVDDNRADADDPHIRVTLVPGAKFLDWYSQQPDVARFRSATDAAIAVMQIEEPGANPPRYRLGVDGERATIFDLDGFPMLAEQIVARLNAPAPSAPQPSPAASPGDGPGIPIKLLTGEPMTLADWLNASLGWIECGEIDLAKAKIEEVSAELFARNEVQALARSVPTGGAVPGIYIASKAVHGPRWRALRDAGWPIISTWIDEAEQGRTTDWADLWDRCAAEPAQAAVTLLYAEDGEILKGALAEVGAALSHGRKVIVVGSLDHTWTKHRNVHRAADMTEARHLWMRWLDENTDPPPASSDRSGVCGQPVELDYTNWRGERSVRTVIPTGRLLPGDDEYHPGARWVIEAWDVAKGAMRTFDPAHVHRWGEQEARQVAPSSPGAPAAGVAERLDVWTIAVRAAINALNPYYASTLSIKRVAEDLIVFADTERADLLSEIAALKAERDLARSAAEDYDKCCTDMRYQRDAADYRSDAAERAKNDAYTERNQIVAALARLFPSGTARTDIPGWDHAWHGCVYVDLPTGQASWHYHDSEAHLFADLPAYQGTWDGHSTKDKYRRIAALRAAAVNEDPGLHKAEDIADHWHQRLLLLKDEAAAGNLTRRRNLQERAEGAKQVLDEIKAERARLSAARPAAADGEG